MRSRNDADLSFVLDRRDAGPYKISLLLWKVMQRFSSSHLNDKSKFEDQISRLLTSKIHTQTGRGARSAHLRRLCGLQTRAVILEGVVPKILRFARE